MVQNKKSIRSGAAEVGRIELVEWTYWLNSEVHFS